MAEQDIIKSLLDVVTEVKTPVGVVALLITVLCIIALFRPHLLGNERGSPLLWGLLGLTTLMSLVASVTYALETVYGKTVAQLYVEAIGPAPAPVPEICKMSSVSCFRVEGHGGLVFGLYRTGQNWLAHRDFIHSKGANLATVPDQEVNKAFVYALMNVGHNRAFIGLNDIDTEGHWVWDAGGDLGQFRNWQIDQPDNDNPHPTGEDHVVLDVNGRWYDVMGGQFGYSLPAFFQIQSAYEAPYY